MTGKYSISKVGITSPIFTSELPRKCDNPTPPKAMAAILIGLGKWCFSLPYCLVFHFVFQIINSTGIGFSHRSILADFPAPNRIKAIQILATTISTVIIAPYFDGLYWYSSNMAVWLAPPPIQLPARC